MRTDIRQVIAGTALLLVMSFPAVQNPQICGLSVRAHRFVEGYRSAPDIGVLGRLAIGFHVSVQPVAQWNVTTQHPVGKTKPGHLIG